LKLSLFNPENIDIERKLSHAINVIRNMDEILSSASVNHKILLIGSMFPEKIVFDGEKYQTNSCDKVLDWIDPKMRARVFACLKTRSHSRSFSVPGAGIEPAQHCCHWCLRPARLPIPPSGH
jgi:site-specific DNA recombinase